MTRVTEKQVDNDLQAAACDLGKIDWSPPAIHDLLQATADGFSHQQRRRMLAGSDPLLADLMLTMDLLDDAVMVLHEDGRVIHLNHGAAVLALPTNGHAIRSLHLLGPDEPWAAARKILREYQKSSGWLERETYDPGTGRYWTLRLSALPYLGAIPRRLVLLIHDNTETVTMRMQMQEREVMATTGALLAGATHQAKNAIFGLSATLDALEEHLGRSDGAKNEYLDYLRSGVTRIRVLMRDLLDYANPTSCNLAPVSIVAAVRLSASECQALADRMECGLEFDMVDDAEVMANAIRLVRALENLLENALQHSPRGANVTIRTSRANDPGLLRLDIIDAGPGYPPEHMEKLFTPFFTLRPGGTGLGLTIAWRIIEDLGGTIQLANGPHKGARVTVFLPILTASSDSRNLYPEHPHAEK